MILLLMLNTFPANSIEWYTCGIEIEMDLCSNVGYEGLQVLRLEIVVNVVHACLAQTRLDHNDTNYCKIFWILIA